MPEANEAFLKSRPVLTRFSCVSAKTGGSDEALEKCFRLRTLSFLNEKSAAALVVFLLVFALYCITAAPTVTFHDSGELIAAASTLGIPHAPGAPVWVLATHPFSWIPIGSPGFRINLGSAFWGALSCVMMLLIVSDLAKATGASSRLSLVCGLFSALLLAQSPAFWGKSVQTELYTMAVLFTLGLILVFIRWHVHHSLSDRAFVIWMALLFGFGAGNYGAILWFAPVFAIAALICRPGMIRSIRLLLTGGIVFALCSLVHLFVLIRSRFNPPIDWGNPETLGAFVSVMQRKQWGTIRWDANSWKFAAEWLDQMSFVSQFGVPALALAAASLVPLLRRFRITGFVLLGTFATWTASMIYMQAASPSLNRDLIYVMTYGIDDFNVPSYAVFALLPGVGLAWLTSLALRHDALRRYAPVFALVAFAGLIIGLWTHYPVCDYHRFNNAEVFGRQLLGSVPPQSVLLAQTDNATFPTAYLKVCEGQRPDVRISMPSAAFKVKLRELAQSRGTTTSTIVRLLADNPDRYEVPLLTQPPLSPDRVTAVHSADLIPDPVVRPLFSPEGMVFRLADRSTYNAEKQLKFWLALLESPSFRLERDSKHDMREAMMSQLAQHAWWHQLNADTTLSAVLYSQALRYAPRRPPELLAATAAVMHEIGHTTLALGLAEEALSIDADNNSALTVAGSIAGEQGDYGRAAESFQRILRRSPGDKTARANYQTSLRNMSTATTQSTRTRSKNQRQ